ncbi:hypothetical protein H4582DRAFT_1997275 [Lactarius indigo]|nr:hypothetical protein H4582DRAFT_1997275 [Lactarius indigo]
MPAHGAIVPLCCAISRVRTPWITTATIGRFPMAITWPRTGKKLKPSFTLNFREPMKNTVIPTKCITTASQCPGPKGNNSLTLTEPISFFSRLSLLACEIESPSVCNL